jgi:hypothetical protein
MGCAVERCFAAAVAASFPRPSRLSSRFDDPSRDLPQTVGLDLAIAPGTGCGTRRTGPTVSGCASGIPLEPERVRSPRIMLAQIGNRLFPFSEWASDSFRDGHLTHPDSAADGGPPHAQNAAREPDSGEQTLDQAKPLPHPSSRGFRAPDLSSAQPHEPDRSVDPGLARTESLTSDTTGHRA